MLTELEQDALQMIYKSAVDFAKEAGNLIRNRLGNLGEIQQKKNISDLVTEVDVLSESLLRGKIEKQYPDHWILSEENCGQADAFLMFKNHDQGYGWIIDPIDGTTNFIHGIPHFSVSIGIVKDGEPVIGIVYNPTTGEIYQAQKGGGAMLNGQPIRVGNEAKLTEAIVATGFQANDFKSGSRLIQQMDNLAGKSRNIRMFGAASIDLCLVATGKISGFWHEGLNPWDTAAGIVILQEAGGKITNKDGQAFKLYDDSLIASNRKIHEEFLNTIKF